ncbi:xanthine dehydrogenase small subunit [Endozoicomonas sp. SM1973]|uniref:Xanthine dehydrogenase small subunit n=1 Tax=Spartinivicinus marinus TaxID=2994442 RepID=A0A853HXL2_9GAMM|nr:xanthine dehydrogenase small subunit [Spartinivicinus marinus]
MIKFLLDDTVQTVENINPNTTVLNYLRHYLNRCGTKEGCGSGDCGACTVVVGELVGETLHYKSINACITFLASLHGKQLVTVESLQATNQLHPVQQAIVDFHGSQCGFCTPGFVMSLYALAKNYPVPSKTQIFTALSGNLCRCTGYRAIVNAAAHVAKFPPPQASDQQSASIVAQLKSINTDQITSLTDGHNQYFAPRSIRQLIDLLQHYPDARLLVGGTDLALLVTQQQQQFNTLINLGNVAELTTIKETVDTVIIGSAVTYNHCFQLLEKQYPEITKMLERLGSQQIRNQGSIGGNIGNASPIGDMPPVLIAVGACLTLRQANSSRQIAIADYFLDYKVTDLQPGEFIQAIHIPKAKPGYQLKIYKISKRFDDDISAILGAFYIKLKDNQIKDIHIAFGGMAAIPKRASHCETALLHQPWTAQTITAATATLTQDFKPLSDVRASANYRMQVAQNLLWKCFLEVSNPSSIIRITDYA